MSFACNCGCIFGKGKGKLGLAAKRVPQEKRPSAETQAAHQEGGRLCQQLNAANLHTKGCRVEWLVIPPKQWEAELLPIVHPIE